LGQGHVVRGKDQFHISKMQSPGGKIQNFLRVLGMKRKSCQILLRTGENRVILGPMGPGLQLSQRLSQSLVLSPQMQQSLALLQAPTMELKALVEQEMQQNPVLEEAPSPEADQAEKTKSEDG